MNIIEGIVGLVSCKRSEYAGCSVSNAGSGYLCCCTCACRMRIWAKLMMTDPRTKSTQPENEGVICGKLVCMRGRLR